MVKRLGFIVVCFLLVALFATPSFSAGSMENAREGFRGIKWGDGISQHPTLVFDSIDRTDFPHRHGFAYYENPKEDLTIDGVRLNSVRYVFYKNKFAVAILEHDWTRKDDVLRLKEVFIERFGDLFIDDRENRGVGWYGAGMVISWHKYGDIGRFYIFLESAMNEFRENARK